MQHRPQPSPRDPRIGERIAGFRLEELVSVGPAATVYRGRCAGQQAAVKIYGPRLTDHILGRVTREGAAARRVSHPAVARLIEWGELADGSAFVATAWIPGPSLEQVLCEQAPPQRAIVEVLSAIARGLIAVHAAHIVHRDLKPANVIVCGGDPAAVLCDFGHSLVLDDDRLTDEGWVVGSAAYMAPEQAAGLPVDGRADLYAAGVILYRALTGAPPFEHRSPAEVLRCHLREPVVPPRVRAPAREIPPALEDLCLWLLAKDPAARLPSARVLHVTLGALHRSLFPSHGVSP